MGNLASNSEKDKSFLSEKKKEKHTSYSGDVTPKEAWEILSKDKKAVLIDVRTMPEWTFVGVPDLASVGKEVIFISWRKYPHMAVNDEFCSQLNKFVTDMESPLFFICRSGHRSMDAALEATKYGYNNCYNIISGFEGDVDKNRHRTSVNGWKIDNLPWGQN